MENIGQVILNALITSSIYLLAGTGLTLTFGLSRFPNFTYAEFITLGAYAGFIFLVQPEGNFLLALVTAAVIAGLVSVLSYSLVFRPLVERRASLVLLMVASIGLGYAIRYTIAEIWSWSSLSYQTVWAAYEVGGIRVTSLWVWIILTAVVAGVALHFFLTRTKTGKAIRAIANNPELASVTGINRERVILLAWFIGAALAGLAGVFRAADTRLFPMLGWDILLPVFAATVLGGIGSFYGLILASLILGFAENFGVIFLSGVGLSTEYRMAIAFLILIIVLLVRPKGIAG
ncbi:MAG: Inner-membrane translocator [Clostridia bacterium 62_21]|nr:MAG: Inner-membrane translocator [Clostridia bacterium 62_21]HAG07103.1 amino acid ABC transporter permease [Peptococcaceae bacterium]